MNVPISEAKARLTDLVRRAEAGDEVILTRHGRPVARLAPVAARPATELQRNTTAERLGFSETPRV
jgi:prevent-host-death family protein